VTTAEQRRERAAREAWQIMTELVTSNERRREVCERVGLSFGKLRTLRRVAKEPLTMGALASLLAIDPPNLTALVDDLERRGFVERRVHPSDRRAKLVVATRSGAALARKAERFLEQPPSGIRALPADELESLRRVLRHARVQGGGLGEVAGGRGA
jgi:DNA-binding MarR family transcriptional regulator